MAKHFWKTVIIFLAMILVGVIGVVLVSNIGKGVLPTDTINTKTQLAK